MNLFFFLLLLLLLTQSWFVSLRYPYTAAAAGDIMDMPDARGPKPMVGVESAWRISC